MGDKTGIEWTDATWNPTVGCDRISPGCAHCYAKTLHDKRHAAHQRGRNVPAQYAQPFEVLQLMEGRLDAPLHWRQPRRVFVNSVSDLFHQDVPDDFIDRVFAVMARTERHTFQVLTKRAERAQAYLSDRLRLSSVLDQWTRLPRRANKTTINRWPLPNVWLGVSVENQRFADERIPLLLQTPAAVRFLSCEPLLSHLNIIQFLSANYISVGGRRWVGAGGIGWVIVGGESGNGANIRPFDIAWARTIVHECQTAGVACFVKQLGARPFTPNATIAAGIPRRERGGDGNFWLTLRDRKGGDPSEWPEDLRVREFPAVRS